MSSPHLHLEVRTYLHPYPPWVCEYLDLSYSLCLLTICIDCCSHTHVPNSSPIYLLAWNNCHLCLVTSFPPPHLNSVQMRKLNTIHSWKMRLRGMPRPDSKETPCSMNSRRGWLCMTVLEINRTVVVCLPTYISMHRTRVEVLVP